VPSLIGVPRNWTERVRRRLAGNPTGVAPAPQQSLTSSALNFRSFHESSAREQPKEFKLFGNARFAAPPMHGQQALQLSWQAVIWSVRPHLVDPRDAACAMVPTRVCDGA
jgi:hypothetical protein